MITQEIRASKKQLKKLASELTSNVRVQFRSNDDTAFNTIHDRTGSMLRDIYININFKQMNLLHDRLVQNLGYSRDIKTFYLQVLLHEICHYKQFIQADDLRYYNRLKEKKEKIAHKYAVRYSKYFTI